MVCLAITVLRGAGDGDDIPTVHVVPDGFKVVQTEYGPDFRCETCDIAVEP
jgi:hypothetical protein